MFIDLTKKRKKKKRKWRRGRKSLSIYFYNKTKDGEKTNQQPIERIIGISESRA